MLDGGEFGAFGGATVAVDEKQQRIGFAGPLEQVCAVYPLYSIFSPLLLMLFGTLR